MVKEVVPVLPDMAGRADACASGCVSAAWGDVAEIAPEDVNENSVLMDDLDLSSMEILTVVADLEETFGLRIPEKELRNFVTIADVADYLADNAG